MVPRAAGHNCVLMSRNPAGDCTIVVKPVLIAPLFFVELARGSSFQFSHSDVCANARGQPDGQCLNIITFFCVSTAYPHSSNVHVCACPRFGFHSGDYRVRVCGILMLLPWLPAHNGKMFLSMHHRAYMHQVRLIWRVRQLKCTGPPTLCAAVQFCLLKVCEYRFLPFYTGRPIVHIDHCFWQLSWRTSRALTIAWYFKSIYTSAFFMGALV